MADAFLPDAFQSERKGKIDQNNEEADAVNAGKFADLDHGKDAPLTAAGEIPRQSGENPGTDPFGNTPPGGKCKAAENFLERAVGGPICQSLTALQPDFSWDQEVADDERNHHAPKGGKGAEHETENERNADKNFAQPHEGKEAFEISPHQRQEKCPAAGA